MHARMRFASLWATIVTLIGFLVDLETNSLSMPATEDVSARPDIFLTFPLGFLPLIERDGFVHQHDGDAIFDLVNQARFPGD